MANYFNTVQSGTKTLLVKYYLVILPFLIPLFWYIFNYKSKDIDQNLSSYNSSQQVSNCSQLVWDCIKTFENPIELDSDLVLKELIGCIFGGTSKIDGSDFELSTSFDEKKVILELYFSNLFFFEKYSYTLPLDYVSHSAYMKSRNIIQFIKESSTEFDKLLFTILLNKQKLKRESGKCKLFINLDLGGIYNILEGFINRITNRKTTIFIKGFADGSQVENWEKVMDKNYFYSAITYYPLPDNFGNRDFEYHLCTNEPETYFISNGIYKNRDLPILRANYILEEFLVPQLKMYNFDNLYLKVLSGKEVKRVSNKPKLRFVDLFIRIEI